MKVEIDDAAALSTDWRQIRPAEIICIPDKEAFYQYIASAFLQLGETIQQQKGFFHVILGGGQTPINVNRQIVLLAPKTQFEFKRVIIFFSDERCVPPDHPASNYYMIKKTLVNPLKIPPANVYRIDCDEGAKKAAKFYERKISDIFGNHIAPRFDLALLGLGPDGHTASLFPQRKVLEEKSRYVLSAGKGPEGHERVTMTFPILNESKNILLMAQGKEKEEAVKRLIDGPYDPYNCPAQGLNPSKGKLIYLLGQGIDIK